MRQVTAAAITHNDRNRWLCGLTLGFALFLLSAQEPVVIGQVQYYYVRAGATGSGNGSDWTNAFATLPTSLSRGATYFVADGSYGSYTFSTPVSANLSITVKKATVAEHGTNTGWIDSYGDGTAAWQPIEFLTSNWVFDGATGGGPSRWKSGHGFTFNSLACTSNTAFISTADGVSNLTISHVAFTQTGSTTTCTTASHGIYTATGGEGAIYNSRFEYLYFDNLGGLPFFMRAGSGNVIQYSYTGDICGMSVANVNEHCETVIVHGMNNTHFRYNYVAESPSSGGFVKNDYEPSTGIYIYGNVISRGVPIVCNHGVCSDWLVLNNTFTNLTSGPVTSSGQISSNSKIYNNIAYQGTVSSFSNIYNAAKYDYTWYSRIVWSSCQMVAAPHDNVVAGADGCDRILMSDDPFVSSTGDLPEHLKLRSSIPGVDVCTLVSCGGNNAFNRDAFGNQRGLDGVWDRGAYEYSGGAGTLQAPKNLRIQP
jgi:hypothetical protein